MNQDEVDLLVYNMSLYNEDRFKDGLRPVTFGEYLQSEFELFQEDEKQKNEN